MGYRITFDLLAACMSLFLIYYIHRRSKRSLLYHLPLPPGPKGYPIIGNLFDVPPTFEWLKYHEWSKDIGSEMIYLEIAGLKVVVLDSLEAATELLERRSSIYSSRPRTTMITELMGWDIHLAFIPYGEQWRSQRKLMHQVFHTAASKNLRPHLLKATHGLLRRILNKRENIMADLRHMAGETIISIAYGLDVEPENDPHIEVAEEGHSAVTVAAVPGTFLVDSLPILKYVPEWIPGAEFKRKAKEWRKAGQTMIEMPFAAAKDRIWGFQTVVRVLLFSAGTDSTVAAIASCIIGLLKRPDVVKRAQEEIDSVIPFGGLPTFDEEDKLPLVTAICMETMRWRPVAPIAVPHLLTQGDAYKGYRLPKGAIIVANVWAMLRNEEVYPDPFSFKPDRFLKDGRINDAIPDLTNVAFGFGRRICPAQHMAFSATWIAVASLIAAFDTTKAVDRNGNIIEADPEYVNALASFPEPFECLMRPRTEKHARAIQATASQDYEFDFR
ncbi:hypothetical protein AX15_005542 [Amanita polypyramis BW_CC]|nr:hypothetical protein AX15_005542 [Amanita polypyramis BW_CC]